ncbi:MAG: UDP-glucose--hexose-1-phosphate uridylyltransferase [Bacillota bacterium]|nr:UDP-glucose--hexose-1-phosphate uridylyltransferase [Bacillota bacterium]
MNINICEEIERLLQYGASKSLMDEADKVYTRNRLLEVLELDDFAEVKIEEEALEYPDEILENIMAWALEIGILEYEGGVYKDLFDTKLMACLMPRPSEVISKFNELYLENKKAATDYYYSLCRYSNYIRTNRVAKDLKWQVETGYGPIDITINLSKPEKDPKAIAAAKNLPSVAYPKCLLCRENEGYAGRLNHPARQNHRVIPVTLNNEDWFFQYSPYVYYNEHCIVFKGGHEPMRICKETFTRLLDFTERFPHYFIGSNADLPIVGGSILSHDHFQGGNYTFAMSKAPVEEVFEAKGLNGVSVGKVKWPMSVIRLEGEIKEEVIDAGYNIYTQWKDYSDESVDVLAYTQGTPHNTVTPIARMKDGKFQLDLVLRNNRTSKEHPDGIFHPHSELHHIKKENIGLIEVMGLAVLPARLKSELKELEYFLLNKDSLGEIDSREELVKHKEWCCEIIGKYGNIDGGNVSSILQKEVGMKFLTVLEHAGVFKRDRTGQEAFNKFVKLL